MENKKELNECPQCKYRFPITDETINIYNEAQKDLLKDLIDNWYKQEGTIRPFGNYLVKRLRGLN